MLLNRDSCIVSKSPMAVSTRETIGKTIVSRFVIRKHLGGGSFGDVYEAEDIQTRQIVAL